MHGKSSESQALKSTSILSLGWLLAVALVLTVVYFTKGYLPDCFVLTSDLHSVVARPWSLFTYGLVHQSATHLITSLVLLTLATLYSGLSVRLFYLIVSVAICVGGLFFTLTYGVIGRHTAELAGASAGICSLFPHLLFVRSGQKLSLDAQVVRLLFVLVAIGDVGYALLASNPGFLAHIGGYLVGLMALPLIRKEQTAQKAQGVLRKMRHSGYASLTDEERMILLGKTDS